MWKKKAGCLLCGLLYDTRNIAAVTNDYILQYQIYNTFRVEATPLPDERLWWCSKHCSCPLSMTYVPHRC